jgi:2,3-bisphosphoglycerate-dependent phosphoglycerate mutase
MPYWNEIIAPEIRDRKKVMIAAHGNSIRALVKHLDEVPDGEITGLNIPTGFPLVYELDNSLHPIRHYYLGDEEEIRHATESVMDQATTKR